MLVCDTVLDGCCAFAGADYACQLRALIEDWRAEFVNSPPDAPFLVNGANLRANLNPRNIQAVVFWRTSRYVWSAIIANCSICDTELGGLQDTQWPVLRQAMHQAVLNLTKTTVIANSDMGDDRCKYNELTLHYLSQVSYSL